MIVYRDQRRRADPRRFLSQLRSRVDWSSAPPSHELAVHALIDAGVLESALADAVFPERDGTDSLIDQLRAASLAAGHVVWHSWHDHPEPARHWWHRFRLALEEIERGRLPPEVNLAVPEGYAYYSLYPEMYLEAAKRCQVSLGEVPVVCLGLRSIGSSLSAVVAAALSEMGCDVDSFTLRPRGHPYSRGMCLDRELVLRITARPQAIYLVIDEGPGISGSSFGGTVAMLRHLGIPDDRICLFPSWRTDGSDLRSAEARRRWTRHRQFTVSFEEVWLDSGRLSAAFPGELRDVSSGAWRSVVYARPSDYPAVQPQHERRKYLLTSASGSRKLLRFVGLTQGSEAKIRRAERLADAGYTLRPEGTGHGFVLSSFVAGEPVTAGEVDAGLIEATASYLAHLSRAHRCEPSVTDSELREMIAVNIGEGLQDSTIERRVADLPSGAWTERPVELDGRMLANEWLRTPAGYIKVDAMDHHDDHFFPGCQDIAWDLAAAVIELKLGPAAKTHLVDRYRSLSGDRTIRERLPAYAVAYLAFRFGYASMAASTLGETADGVRFKKESRRYAGLISRELGACSMVGQGA